MTPPKANNSTIIDLNDTDVDGIPNKEFKTIAISM
jgi:hypothetical protein